MCELPVMRQTPLTFLCPLPRSLDKHKHKHVRHNLFIQIEDAPVRWSLFDRTCQGRIQEFELGGREFRE